MSFDQKTPQKSALVTGATSGIGFYLAKHLALNGFKVYALGRRVERMEPLKEFGVQYSSVMLRTVTKLKK